MDNAKRRWGDRRDGRWLREEDSLHQITPYLMPNRADNEAFIKEQIDLTAINAYLAEKNAGDIDFKYTFFHIIVAALVKTVTLRPRMNRFIQGRRLYLRNELSAAFVVKKQFTDSAHEALAFIRFTEEDTVDSVHNKIRDEVRVNRKAGNVDNSTSAMDMLCKLPRAGLPGEGALRPHQDRSQLRHALSLQPGVHPTQRRVSPPEQLGHQLHLRHHR